MSAYPKRSEVIRVALELCIQWEKSFIARLEKTEEVHDIVAREWAKKFLKEMERELTRRNPK